MFLSIWEEATYKMTIDWYLKKQISWMFPEYNQYELKWLIILTYWYLTADYQEDASQLRWKVGCKILLTDHDDLNINKKILLVKN